ncbi:mitochondrial genome maintenance MGM101 [Amanita rubescens]|nr:mitochondrial genome maintenance MGM101 [Amanita rubescens]
MSGIFLASRLCFRTPLVRTLPIRIRALSNAPGVPKTKEDVKPANSNHSMNDTPTPLPEFPVGNMNGESHYDWSKSYFGLSTQAFPKDIADVLLAPIDSMDIEIKPDGLIYLPEIKYRRILNKAVCREYALVCQGRLVAIARGEQEYFDPSCNALMRCSKDLGIASELWDPRFIREFKEKYCTEVFAEHIPTKKKKKLWRRKDHSKLGYPYQE